MNEKESGREHTGIAAEMKVLLREPPLLIGILAVFLLFAVFIIYPFVKILLVPTSADWMRAVTDKEFIEVFSHTIFSSFVATATAIVFGFIFAYGVNYTNMPCKRFFQVVALLPTMAPSVVSGLAFIMLFGRRGFITWEMLHLKVDLYGPVGLWAAQTIAFFPLAYITISGVLKNISPNLELAAQNLGAKGWYLFRTVTLRLATPGLASAFLLVGINSLADFGNPMLVGGNYHVLATEAYTQVTGAWDLPMGATLSVFLVIPTLIVFFVQRYYLEHILYAANRRFQEMSAGQFELRMYDLEKAGEGKNRGLDLMVYSTVTGKEREVRTLSGGESFMAALSLALGMADQIQQSSAAINLDMMFIDEGFGSLDEHSRNQAVRVLQEMAEGSRLIGIISHVSELKQEIEDQLLVNKDENGSHVKWQIS